MEREVFHYMKYDNVPMPYNDDDVFESALVENYAYNIPEVCAYSLSNLKVFLMKSQIDPAKYQKHLQKFLEINKQQ